MTRAELQATLGTSDADRWGNEEAILDSNSRITLEHIAWRRRQIDVHCGGSIHQFKRQYPLNPQEVMVAGGNHVFDLSMLKRMSEQYVSDPLWQGDLELGRFQQVDLKESRTGATRVWEPPEPGAEYIAVSDHAQGLSGGDYSFGIIIRRMPLKVVATCRAVDGHQLDPVEFGNAMYSLLLHYNSPLYCPESNMDGGYTAALMQEKGYASIVTQGMFGIHSPKSSEYDKLGLMTTRLTRPRMIRALIEWIKDDVIEIPCAMIISQLETMVYNKQGKPEASKKGAARTPGESERGFYDDGPMALSVGALLEPCLSPPQTREQNLPTRVQQMSYDEVARNEHDGLWSLL